MIIGDILMITLLFKACPRGGRINCNADTALSDKICRAIYIGYSAQLSLCLAWLRLSLVVELKEEKSNRAEPIPGNVLV